MLTPEEDIDVQEIEGPQGVFDPFANAIPSAGRRLLVTHACLPFPFAQHSATIRALFALQHHHGRRLLSTGTTSAPVNPFLLDNRFLGNLYIESHPSFGGAEVRAYSKQDMRSKSRV